MKDHISAIHQDIVRYECSQCDYKNYHKHILKYHVGKNHKFGVKIIKIGEDPNKKCQNSDLKRERGKIKCTKCDSIFQNHKLRLIHFKETHPGENIYQCNHCDYGSNYLPNLNDHVNSLHEKKKLECDKCDFTTTWNQSFHLHMRRDHDFHLKNSKHNTYGETLLCDNCAFTTNSQAKFEIHKSQAHNQKKFQCEKCDHRTSYKSNLKLHMKEIHSEIILSCDQCDFTTNTQRKLKHHVGSIHENIRYNCNFCPYQATRTLHLNIHVKRVHK